MIALSVVLLLWFLVGPVYAHLPTDNPSLADWHWTDNLFLADWHWRADVLLVVAPFGTLYAVGWLRLRKQGSGVVPGWQPGLYMAGLGTLCVALLSPLDSLASFLLFMHMVQHELLFMIAPPLLLLADPLPALLWGLPRSLRHKVGHLLIRSSGVRRALRILTLMPIAWILYVVNLWGWHHPVAYEAALRNEWIHDLQHICFFMTGLLFWWPVVNPAPRLHGRIHYGLRIVYVFLAATQDTLLSGLIALTDRVLYPYYSEEVPRLWGWTPLDDQAWGGAVMWGTGSMMYMITILVLVARMLEEEEQGHGYRKAQKLEFRLASGGN